MNRIQFWQVMEQEKKDHSFWVFLFALALLAAILRGILAIDQSIRLEEALQWVLATHLSDALKSTQPPFFTILLAGWIRLFGDHVIILRLLSIIAGLAGVVFIGLLGKRAAGNSFGIVIAILFATNPLLAFVGANATSYSLMLALSLAGFWLLVLQLDIGESDPLIAASFSGICIFGIFTHFFFLVIIALMWIYFGLFRANAIQNKDLKKQVTLSLCIPSGIFLFYLPIAWSQVKLYLQQNESFQSAFRFPSSIMIGWFSDAGQGAPIDNPSWIAPVFLALTFVLLAFGAVLSVIRKRNVDSVIALLFLGGVVVSLIVSMIVPIINNHLVWFLTPGTLMMVGLGMMGLKRYRWVAVALFAGIGIFGIVETGNAVVQNKYFWKANANWNHLVDKIGKELSLNDEVIIEPAWFSAPLLYHANRNVKLGEKLNSPLPLILVLPGETDQLEINSETNRIFFICANVLDCNHTRKKLIERRFSQGEKLDFTGITLVEYQSLPNSSTQENVVAK